MQGAVNFFGRVAMLIDQNTQAFHMFMSALLQVHLFFFYLVYLGFVVSSVNHLSHLSAI